MRTLHRLRSYYNKYITAIQNAVTAKQAQIKQLQTLQAADDSIIPERDILGDGKEASLDRWLEDPNYTYGKVVSLRKYAEQRAKGAAEDAATLRSAIAWANAERSDYIRGLRKYMHTAAALGSKSARLGWADMLIRGYGDASLYEEAYAWLYHTTYEDEYSKIKKEYLENELKKHLPANVIARNQMFEPDY